MSPPAVGAEAVPALRPASRLGGAAIVNLVALALGLALLVLLCLRLDLRAVLAHAARLGAWAALLFALYLAGLAAGAAAWQTMIDPRRRRARYGELLVAFWAGHAINVLTPLGALGEVVRGTMMKDRVDRDELVASLVTFHFMSKVSMLAVAVAGPLLCLPLAGLPRPVLLVLLALAAACALPYVALWLLLRAGLVARVVRLGRRLPFLRGRDPAALAARAAAIDLRLRDFRRAAPARFRRAVLWLTVARLVNVADFWLLLLVLAPGHHAAWLAAVALLGQSSTHLVTWAATLVPGQIGVAEGGSAVLYRLLGFGATLGLALELVRRVRSLLGAGLGLGLAWVAGWIGRRRARGVGPGGGRP